MLDNRKRFCLAEILRHRELVCSVSPCRRPPLDSSFLSRDRGKQDRDDLLNCRAEELYVGQLLAQIGGAAKIGTAQPDLAIQGRIVVRGMSSLLSRNRHRSRREKRKTSVHVHEKDIVRYEIAGR